MEPGGSEREIFIVVYDALYFYSIFLMNNEGNSDFSNKKTLNKAFLNLIKEFINAYLKTVIIKHKYNQLHGYTLTKTEAGILNFSEQNKTEQMILFIK